MSKLRQLLILLFFFFIFVLILLILILILLIIVILIRIISILILLILIIPISVLFFLLIFISLFFFILLSAGVLFLLIAHGFFITNFKRLSQQQSILQVSNMNIYSIKEDARALEQIGVVIDTPERLKLELGLIRLSELANADQLLFWGKIITTSSPYYIAVAIDFKGNYAFPHKKFYFSKDNFIFSELPALDQYNRAQANNFNTLPFTGNPATILLNSQPEGQQNKAPVANQNDDSEEQVVKISPKNYTQEDRLAYTVLSIEQECQIVPVGTFRMVPSHEIRYNEQYKSIKPSQFALSSFNHFRYPLTIAAKQRLESSESVFSFDLFDKIENPYFWSAQLNSTQNIGTVRSLIWFGYIAYLNFNKSSFGGLYYGNGLKQTELAFYI